MGPQWICRPWLEDLLSLGRDNKLTMPPDLAMLLKVFVSLDGAFKKLDPGFDIMAAIQPILHEAVIDKLSPQALGKRGLKTVSRNIWSYSLTCPRRYAAESMRRRPVNLKIRVELSQVDELRHAGHACQPPAGCGRHHGSLADQRFYYSVTHKKVEAMIRAARGLVHSLCPHRSEPRPKANVEET